MPSFTQAQLHAAHSRMTNKQLSHTHQAYNNGFYPIVDLKQGENDYPLISINPNVEIAVKDDNISNVIEVQIGGRPSTRSDIQEGRVNISGRPQDDLTRRLLTVAGAVKLTHNDETAYPVHIRNGHMPLPGKITTPSGLVSGEMANQALWLRINQEAGYCHLDKENQRIQVIVLQPDAETLQAHPDLLKTIINEKMRNQHAIRTSVAEQSGIVDIKNVEKWDIQIVRVDSKLDFTPEQENNGTIQHVHFERTIMVVDEDKVAREKVVREAAIPGFLHDDAKRQTVTVMVPLAAEIPFPLEEMIFVDPEGHDRETGLLTEQEFHAMSDKGVPALNAYVSKVTGNPIPAPKAPAPAAAPAAAPAPAAA